MALIPLVTTAVRWESKKLGHFGNERVERPKVTLNLAFSFWGLLRCGLSSRMLEAFTNEFTLGMAARAIILGDRPQGAEFTEGWDSAWVKVGNDPRQNGHILIMLNAQMDPKTGAHVPELDGMCDMIRGLCDASDGFLELLPGHSVDETGPWQDMSALLDPTDDGYVANAKEHFGFTDSISDPVFEGQYPPSLEEVKVKGNGKYSRGKWEALATGEFLLGYPDEAQEIPIPGTMRAFARNGTFIAYRKLQQNVVAFRNWIDETAGRFGATFHISDRVAARETLMAKIAGRWPDGAPLTLFPHHKDWLASTQLSPDSLKERRELCDFTYYDDPLGARCPLTSHTRRNNPRDANGPIFKNGNSKVCGSVLTDRRRILRRGVPYGVCPPDATVDGDHGIVILIMCADLGRQFEFMQQQWVNYGNDSNAGNDTDPLIGLRNKTARFLIPADPADNHAPFIADALPQFVVTKGGDYFFMPSIYSLNMLALGLIDPT
jgi:Dyp-type peroxidase family